jgi:membrane-bound serine protease (ClpP class)
MLLVIYGVSRSQRGSAVAGEEGMVGLRGTAVSNMTPTGRVYVNGEYWDAQSTLPVTLGQEVEVVRLCRDLTLEVRPVPEKQLQGRS